ncbi:MAG TPA: hypothetical protein VJL08_03725 [Dehalococcoidia bacterium]|nr:hypothetical protein [Dehalococcoidia bacterium]
MSRGDMVLKEREGLELRIRDIVEVSFRSGEGKIGRVVGAVGGDVLVWFEGTPCALPVPPGAITLLRRATPEPSDAANFLLQ